MLYFVPAPYINHNYNSGCTNYICEQINNVTIRCACERPEIGMNFMTIFFIFLFIFIMLALIWLWWQR